MRDRKDGIIWEKNALPSISAMAENQSDK